jgi:hypothetical protein
MSMSMLPEVPAVLDETVGASSSLRNESSITSSAIGHVRFLAGLNFCQNFLELVEQSSSVRPRRFAGQLRQWAAVQ